MIGKNMAKKLLNEDQNRLLEVARRVIRMESEAVSLLLAQIDERFVTAVELIYQSSGRVVVTGIGKSGAIGRKLAATLASTGTAAYFLHPTDGMHGDIGIVHRDDVVVCLSKSGESEELFTLIPSFKKIGVPIISITANGSSMLAKQSDVVLTIAQYEEACPYDLAPTTSTTAMLALGDAIAMALLEKRQFTREDFAFLHPSGSLGKRLLVKVDDVMETGERIPYVLPEATMKEVVLQMTAKRGICMIVDSDLHVLGVITNGDLNRLVEKTEHFFHISASEVMNCSPKTIESGTLAYTAFKKMEHFRIIAMPVLSAEQKLVGVVHLHDILRAGIV
jgi:arabinose-5-phosphate isomerase